MGAHAKAPSKVVVETGTTPLDKLIAQRPAAILGKRVERSFSGKMPFLFKLLAVETPLSIQAHPDAAFAAAGYRRENALHIPLDAPHRNYRDSNHKPELVCAVTDFQVLKGFRPIHEIVDFFKLSGLPEIEQALEALRRNPDANRLARFYRAVMRLDSFRQSRLIETLKLAKEKIPGDAWSVFMQLCASYPLDVGVFSPFLFNCITLKPGDALFVRAGELHAYLRGACIELMANSDNVIRGGLTSKHIDLDELFRVVKVATETPTALQPQADRSNAIRAYPSSAKEFVLSVIDITRENRAVSVSTASIEILLCLRGKMRLYDPIENRSLDLSRGDSCLIPASTSAYRIEGEGTAYRASVPPPPKKRGQVFS